MPLTGELEHLPIVDVIQLIHSTRKSGTLNIYSRKGEGQLVFDNGYIVGASHSNDKFRIGQILLEADLINQQELDKALEIQKQAGSNRQPLITTLVEYCHMSKESAYKSLETLIEMTVVEMISWTRGIFSLDVDKISISDDYRYLPAQLQPVTLDTQMVLMDALRIFDEKVYAGEIEIVDEPLEEPPQLTTEETLESVDEEEGVELSADILGLGDLDNLARKKPRVFKSLETFDPTEIHRQVVNRTLTDLSPEQSDQLVNYLAELSTPSFANDAVFPAVSKSQAIIMYCNDEFIQHALMTVCKKEGILVFTTAKSSRLDELLDQAINKSLEPILVFGSPDDSQTAFSTETVMQLRKQKLAEYPQISVIQLASPLDYAFSLQSLNAGVRAVFPQPYFSERRKTYVEDTINFLNSFQTYVRSCFNEERRQQFARLRNSMSGLRLLQKAPDISLSVLQFVAASFERTLTLVVDKSALVAERSIGIATEKNHGPAAPLRTRIPVTDGSLLQRLIQEGTTYWGPNQKDGALERNLFPGIGAPRDSSILLLPLKSNGRVITVTYADFGDQQAEPIQLDFLDFFVSQAGMAMENALFRKQLGNHIERKQIDKV